MSLSPLSPLTLSPLRERARSPGVRSPAAADEDEGDGNEDDEGDDDDDDDGRGEATGSELDADELPASLPQTPQALTTLVLPPPPPGRHAPPSQPPAALPSLSKAGSQSMMTLTPATPTETEADRESREQIETLVQELEKQLEIELKIKSGAEQLYRHYTLRKRQNKKSTAETLETLSRTTTRIEKLTKEIKKLRSHAQSLGIEVGRRPSGHTRAASTPNDDEEGDNDGPPYLAVVQSRVQRIKEWIERESTIKAGVEKMAKAMGATAASTDKSVSEVFKSLSNCTARLALLNTALLKYQNMLMGESRHEAMQLHPTPYSFTPYVPPAEDAPAARTSSGGTGKSMSPRRYSFFQGSLFGGGGSRDAASGSSSTTSLTNAGVTPSSSLSSISYAPSAVSGQGSLSSLLSPTTSLSPSASGTLKREAKVQLSGRLTVKVVELVDLFKPASKPEDVHVLIKVDGTVRDKTRPKSRSSSPEWNETFVVKLEKAVEMELEVYEGVTLRGLVSFRLGECQQEWSLTDGVIFAYFSVEPVGQLRLQLQFVKDVAPTRRLSQKVRRGAIVRKKEEKQNSSASMPLSFGNSFATSLFPARPKVATKVTDKVHTRSSFTTFFTTAAGVSDSPVTEALDGSGKEKRGSVTTLPNLKSSALKPRLHAPAIDGDDSIHKSMHPSTSLDSYHMVKTLGRGNFGKVMLVEEKGTRKLFALKVLKKQNIVANEEMSSVKTERLIFQIANKDQHPFLVNLHACFQSPTRLFFVMDYIAGGDLMLHIQRTPFTVERAVFYGAEVLLALEYLHKNNVIYRDLKLDNILLGVDGHIRIADYGLCKALNGPDQLTSTFCGTPEFMAPEILKEEDYGRAVDWWAYGVLLYEMLLSESPFDGEGEDEIFNSVLNADIVYPDELPSVAASLLKKLLVRDPQQRLGSSHRDAEDIKRHPFFRGIDWDKLLRREIPPPCKPHLLSERDTTNFDSSFTSEPALITPMESTLSKFEQAEFENFSYTAPWLEASADDSLAQPLPSAGANASRDSVATLFNVPAKAAGVRAEHGGGQATPLRAVAGDDDGASSEVEEDE